MSYRVQLARTLESFEVAADDTVLAAALRANVNLAHDCQAGGCGTCRVRLIEGRVAYQEFPLALTPEEEQAGYALACQASPLSDLVIEPAAAEIAFADPVRYDAIVKDIAPVSRHVVHLTLELPEALDYRAGQYMNVVMPDGSTHSFSMASAPRGPVVDFHVRRLPAGRFTDHRLTRLKRGETLAVELPLGSFCLRTEDDRPLLMVATGTGLAPLKAMIESVMDDSNRPPIALYWGTRAVSDLYLHRELEGWATQLDDFRYVPVLSRADDEWAGCRGYVQDAVARDLDDLSGHAIYLCGSPEMISGAKQAFIARSASIAHIYAEGFTSHHAPSAAPEGAELQAARA